MLSLSLRSPCSKLRSHFALLVLSLAVPASAMKGPKIDVRDFPSYKEGTPSLVFVEVGDFQCPYCGEGARELLPKIVEKYVRSGKVELLHLDLPLQMHPDALKSAQAAACAKEQGKYWEMHNVLFANQRALGADRLDGHAEQAGLDVPAFQKCMAGGKNRGSISSDVRTAHSLGISGTPAYLLARRIPGGTKVEVLETIRGLPPYEEVEGKIEALLIDK